MHEFKIRSFFFWMDTAHKQLGLSGKIDDLIKPSDMGNYLNRMRIHSQGH